MACVGLMGSLAITSSATAFRPSVRPVSRASSSLGQTHRLPLPFTARKTKLPASQRRQIQVRAEDTAVGTAPAGPVTDNDFEELVLKSPVPVLVDFWAPWCGPCRMIAPLIDELAVEYGDKLRAFKLNTDESPGVAAKYGIRSIPTVMIFKNGEKMDTVIGAVPKATLESTIDKYIA